MQLQDPTNTDLMQNLSPSVIQLGQDCSHDWFKVTPSFFGWCEGATEIQLYCLTNPNPKWNVAGDTHDITEMYIEEVGCGPTVKW